MKLTSIEGQSIPQVVFRTRDDNQWRDVSTDELFQGKTVIVFSLPGAYTPTCSIISPCAAQNNLVHIGNGAATAGGE